MKPPRILFLALSLLVSATGAHAYTTSCGNSGNNDNDCPPCGSGKSTPPPIGPVGANPINPQRGSLQREITDLQTFGAAPIEFTRIYNSRTREYTKPRWELGTTYTWQHNWQYELRESTATDYGFPRLIVRYPQGREYYFRAVDATGTVRVSDASWGDRLYPTGTGTYTVRSPAGREYDFRKVGTGSNYQYLLDQVRNGLGWRWTLTYQTQADGKQRLYRITNNYGRYLQLNRVAGANGYYQLTSVAANDGRSVNFGYSTWASTSETVLTSVTYPDSTAAAYTWCGSSSVTSGPPVLASADDPMQSSSGSCMKYSYNYTAAYYVLPYGIVTATYTYDDNSHLLTLSHANGTSNVAHTQYTYNSINLRDSEERDGAGDDSFTYDGADQLISVDYETGRLVGYNYDAAGNRTLVSDNVEGNTAYPTANALNQYGPSTAGYDTNGNLMYHNDWMLTYDSNNRLVEASGPSDDLSFAQDPRNRCVKRLENTTLRFLIYDGWNLIAEYNADGTLLTKYINGPRIDEILTKINSTGPVYYHENGIGSTLALSDAAGNAIERYTYDVYGKPTFQNASGTPILASAYGNRFLFTGREWFALPAFYDYRNRMYSPDLGRFLQTDPIRFDAEDVNLYRYCANDPVNKRDPMGLEDADMSTCCLELGGKMIPTWQAEGYVSSEKCKEDAAKSPLNNTAAGTISTAAGYAAGVAVQGATGSSAAGVIAGGGVGAGAFAALMNAIGAKCDELVCSFK